MTTIFTVLPGPQMFEIIRNQLKVVLDFELNAIGTLDINFVVPTVYVERMYGFDSATEFPAINITYASGEYKLKNKKGTRGEYLFNIGIYTNSPTVNEEGVITDGDKLAALKMQRIAGFVRTILESYCYFKLELDTTNIACSEVLSFDIVDKSRFQDALSDICGRIQLKVTAEESNVTKTVTTILEGNDTMISKENSNVGHSIIYNQ